MQLPISQPRRLPGCTGCEGRPRLYEIPRISPLSLSLRQNPLMPSKAQAFSVLPKYHPNTKLLALELEMLRKIGLHRWPSMITTHYTPAPEPEFRTAQLHINILWLLDLFGSIGLAAATVQL